MKKFLIVITNIILTTLIALLICLLSVSFSIKDVIINTISKEIVSKKISGEISENTKNIYNDIDYDTLKKIEMNIVNNPSINSITKKYFDEMVNYIVNGSDITIPDIKEDLIDLINQNEAILKQNNIEITDEQKNKLVDKITKDEKINKAYQNVAKSIKDDMSDENVKVLKIYEKITDNSFRLMVFSIIILCIIIIALLKKSFYRWTYNLAISFAIAGASLTLIAPFMVNILFSNTENEFNLNLNSLTNFGYGCFGVCAVLIIIYMIFNMISKHNKQKYDY